ncbi:MAG: hypothetical protein QOI23_559, partial [Chloroflexota bacterium]|nr:hypothetical protein [Chloroflexota bacterium]
MDSDLKPSEIPGADSLLGFGPAGWSDERQPALLTSWRLPLITSLAAAVIIGAVAVRLWEANLP